LKTITCAPRTRPHAAESEADRQEKREYVVDNIIYTVANVLPNQEGTYMYTQDFLAFEFTSFNPLRKATLLHQLFCDNL